MNRAVLCSSISSKIHDQVGTKLTKGQSNQEIQIWAWKGPSFNNKPTQRRSQRSLQALWSPPVGCPWSFKPCKCMQMEIHRKTFKKLSRNILHFIRITTCYETYLNALDRDKKVTSSAEKVSCQSVSSSDQRWASGAARKKTASCCLPMKPGKADNEAAPMLHKMNLLKSRSWGHVGHFLTRLTKETRAMELMTLKKHKDATCQRDAVCTAPCQNPTNLSCIRYWYKWHSTLSVSICKYNH